MKIEDEKLVGYIKKYIKQQLIKFPELLKVFSKSDIKSRLKQNIKEIYISEENEEITTKKKSIMVIHVDKDSTITIENIKNNKDIQNIILHEGIHALTINDKEIEKNKFNVGALKFIYDEKENKIIETGRCFNEGLTEWVVTKVNKEYEFKDTPYSSLLQCINIIENFIGTQNVVTFLRGDYDEIFSKLNMDSKKGIEFFNKMDEMYEMEQYLNPLEAMKKYISFKSLKETPNMLFDNNTLDNIIQYYEFFVKDTDLYKEFNSGDISKNYNLLNEKYILPVEKNLQNIQTAILQDIIDALAINKIKMLETEKTGEFLKIHNAIYILKDLMINFNINEQNKQKIDEKFLEYENEELKFLENVNEVLIDGNGFPINNNYILNNKSLVVPKKSILVRISDYVKEKLFNNKIEEETKEVNKEVLNKYKSDFEKNLEFKGGFIVIPHSKKIKEENEQDKER